ncbi:MAG: hypothetical protein NWR50_03265 [Crocinitomicaceae bacterium]|jgi:hypothetical protein|nr:hypothetical protein [Crocinitomicaceae bacterium]
MSEIENPQKKSNGAFVAIIIILLLGLAAMAYLWSSKNSDLNQCKSDNALLNSDMDGMNDMMSGYVGGMTNDIKTDFKEMLKTYDLLLEKDKSKADSINKQKAEIAELLEKVERGNMSARQLFSARKEIETMKKIMRGYIVQIDSLNTLNYRLTSDLETTNTKLSQTTDERDQYKNDAEKSAEQVKKGSKLQAYNFSSGGLRMKLNNTTEESNKAKSVVQIKSAFTISENPITPAGNKTVYLQVITPEGKTLQSSSGNIISTDAGSIPYSDKKDIDYNNQRIDMAIYYRLNGEELTKGNYKVKIYCQGQLIGSDSFTLK